MTKLYAIFDETANADRAAGALLDYGLRDEDISLVRTGSEAELRSWATHRLQAMGPPQNFTGAEFHSDENRAGSDCTNLDIANMPVDIVHGQFLDKVDLTMQEVLRDPHLAAAERMSQSAYAETRAEDHEELPAKNGISITTGSDAAAGAIKGAEWGLGVGVISALAALFIPGFGLILGGGALAGAVAGAVASAGAGAAAGAVTGYLKDQGMEETVARHYGAVAAEGALLEVTLPSGDVTEETARDVLRKYGASNIGIVSQQGHHYLL